MTPVSAELLGAVAGVRPSALMLMADTFEKGLGFAELKIPKRGGGARTVLRPVSEFDLNLKMLRRAIEKLSTYSPPDYVHGFVTGRSIISNATAHLGRSVVLRLDLASFFESISNQSVFDSMTRFGFDETASKVITGCACVRGSVPAGFSTSPTLSNMVFLEADQLLARAADSLDLVYTRYADDLAFSGSLIGDAQCAELTSLIEQCGYRVNPRKTRFMREGRAQYVTGLFVGDSDQPHVPRRMKRLLRQQAFYIDKYGYLDAQRHSARKFSPNQLRGWVHYITTLHPELGAQLQSKIFAHLPRTPKRSEDSDYWDDMLEELEVPDYL